jgi:hypothetical protein
MGRTLFDIRYCITLLHLLHALMLLIPMVLLALALGGHVGISVPAISSVLALAPFLLPFVSYSALRLDSFMIRLCLPVLLLKP